MIFTSLREISGYEDKEGIEKAKRGHNAAALRLIERVRMAGYDGFVAGYNGCPLCDPCKRLLNEPCTF